ncbi:MAG: 2-hydroxycarboxylate transporter family protein [Treponema sp.]|jgi:Na+/citrate or Na+/malate symporter|nr:2-hydroxycarboxylate transporter family protein [Treponema sp.]
MSVLSTFNVGFIKLKYFLLILAVTVIAVIFNALPPGWLGGFVVCSVFGMALISIGDITPIIKDYFGGGAFLAIFGGAALIYFKVFPEATSKLITAFLLHYF